MGRDPTKWATLLDRANRRANSPARLPVDPARVAASKAGRAAKRAGKRTEDLALAGAALDQDIAVVHKRNEAWRCVGPPQRGRFPCVPVEASGPDLLVIGTGWVGLVEVKGTGDASLPFDVAGAGQRRRPLVAGKQAAMLDEALRRGHRAAVLAKVRDRWWLLPWGAYKALETRRRAVTLGRRRIDSTPLAWRWRWCGGCRGGCRRWGWVSEHLP